MKEMNEFIKKIVEKFKPEFIALFGSRARGDYLKESDFDYVIVADSFEKKHFFDRIREVTNYWSKDNSLEVFPYTPKEFVKKFREHSLTAIDSLNEGKCVYGVKNFLKYKKELLEPALEQKKFFKTKEGLWKYGD